MWRRIIFLFILSVLISACTQATSPTKALPSRLESIPTGTVKMLPAGDNWPPVAAPGWSKPRPLEGSINTAGGEDSPFIPLDGGALYFFFTPDVSIPAEKQLLDGVTGIWMAQRARDGWEEAQRVQLGPPGEMHLDGCPFAVGDLMLFCTVRESTQGELRWFKSTWADGKWIYGQEWYPEADTGYQIGELHLNPERSELYFGSNELNGYGGFDIWVATWTGEGWGEPANLGQGVNSAADENRPYLSPDGNELWFDSTTRTGEYFPGPAVFRSIRNPDGTWGEAQEIVSQFAGEPVLTPDGNMLYFVHHYYDAKLEQMIEADIYVTRKENNSQ